MEYSQGKTRGRVEKKLTSATPIKGHTVAASSNNPEYLVQSDKSGKKAAHQGRSLKKIGSQRNPPMGHCIPVLGDPLTIIVGVFQLLNEPPIRDGDCVLYRMQQSQRAEYNHTLE